MVLVTEVRFAHERGALADTLTAMPDVSVDVVREASTAPGHSAYFFRFGHSCPEDVRPVLETDRTVRDFEPVSAVDDQRLWKIELAPETKLLSPIVTEQGGFVLDARSSHTRRDPRGWRERWFFPDQDGITVVWQHARAEEFEFDVLDLTRQLQPAATRMGTTPLTEQQRRTLLTAYERGYFEEPRKTSLEDLAETFDVSPSAINGRLRRGLKALIAAALIVEVPDEASTTVETRGVPTLTVHHR